MEENELRISAFSLAQRFLGLRETPGVASNAHVLSMLQLDAAWVQNDEVPWCSAYVNYICWLLRLPRSKSLSARSWLGVGIPVNIDEAKPGFDVVVLQRGGADEPGPEVLAAPGHVGFFAGRTPGQIHVLGGNQSNTVSVQAFEPSRLLGLRRLV